MMPRIESADLAFARSTLKKGKIFTLPKLVEILQCSSRTGQTKLKMWNTYTSYNQNGKYYTLPEIPRFDEKGLWRFKNAAFSRHGNLKKTIIHLVNASTSGLSGSELGKILGLAPQSFVHHFRDVTGLRREKHGGVYVYFSDESNVYNNQVRERTSGTLPALAVSAGDAVMILVAIIKHHGISLEDILMLPEVKKSRLPKSAVQHFLYSHGLLKKNQATLP
jgi:hypothetical protein